MSGVSRPVAFDLLRAVPESVGEEALTFAGRLLLLPLLRRVSNDFATGLLGVALSSLVRLSASNADAMVGMVVAFVRRALVSLESATAF